MYSLQCGYANCWLRVKPPLVRVVMDCWSPGQDNCYDVPWPWPITEFPPFGGIENRDVRVGRPVTLKAEVQECPAELYDFTGALCYLWGYRWRIDLRDARLEFRLDGGRFDEENSSDCHSQPACAALGPVHDWPNGVAKSPTATATTP